MVLKFAKDCSKIGGQIATQPQYSCCSQQSGSHCTTQNCEWSFCLHSSAYCQGVAAITSPPREWPQMLAKPAVPFVNSLQWFVRTEGFYCRNVFILLDCLLNIWKSNCDWKCGMLSAINVHISVSAWNRDVFDIQTGTDVMPMEGALITFQFRGHGLFSTWLASCVSKSIPREGWKASILALRPSQPQVCMPRWAISVLL